MQEINLYQPAAKGVRGALSGSSTRTMFLVVFAALSGLWGFAYWQVDRLSEATRVVRIQQEAQAAMAATEGPELASLSDEELESLLTRLAGAVETKSHALSILSAEQRIAGGFSARMRAFAARHIEGIWLDRLTLGAGVEAVSVSGSTLSPDSVPRYLRSLAADPALKGGQIDEFIIEKPAAGEAARAGRLNFRAGRRGLGAPEPRPGEIS